MRLPRRARLTAITLLGAFLAGVVAASLGRVAMRIIAVAGGDSFDFVNLNFTLEGTTSILLRETVFALPLALLLLAARKWLPGVGYQKVVAYGLAFVVFPGLLLLTDSEFSRNSVNATYGRALFTVCYFSYGALVGWVIETLDQQSVPPELSPARIGGPM